MDMMQAKAADPIKDVSVPPEAHHRGEGELPFVPFGPGTMLQLVQVNLQTGLWVVRQRMKAGTTLPPHNHTGTVNAFTLSGSWKYLEYPEVNTAGSYLFEPAGSIHTLHVPPTNTEDTEVWFAISGANLNLDEEGKVFQILDAGLVLRVYLSRCFKAGLPMPQVIGAAAESEAYWKSRAA